MQQNTLPIRTLRFAQREREMISARTKAVLVATKSKDVNLGTSNLNMEIVKQASEGVRSRKRIADDNANKVIK